MHTELRDYIDYDLIPALFDKLDHPGVLEEFGFKRYGTVYKSTTRHKHTGREGNSTGQVVVYPNNPGRFIDHSEMPRSQEIIDYVQRIREGKDIGFMPALTQLAAMAGIEPYKLHLTAEQAEARERSRRAAEIWEAAVIYCIHCIHDGQYKDQAAATINYLQVERKYTIPDIQAMQLGYLPSLTALYDHLTEQGFPRDEVQTTIQFPVTMGDNYKLTIPIRNASGDAIGMAVRKVNGEGPKYFYNKKLNKGAQLFNLFGKATQGRVVLVEGQLDAAIATAREYTWASVAAIGGKSISPEQIKHLVKAGAKEVFIALDNEEGTKEQIKKTVDLLKDEERIEDRIFIVEFPEGYKDADELITKNGIESFQDGVKKALVYYDYYAERLSEEFNKKTEEGQSVHIARQHLIDDIEKLAAGVKDPVKRDDLKNTFLRVLNKAGVTTSPEAFAEAVDRIAYREEEAKQRKHLERLNQQINTLIKGGAPIEEITKKLEESRHITVSNRKAEFERLLNQDQSESAVMERYANLPEGVNIGYSLRIDGEDEPLQFPAGQLSFIAAPTGHGKTLMLINSAINIVQSYPTKQVYFFTFEQSADLVLIDTLNAYMDLKLNKGSNRKTLRNLYRSKGNEQYISRDVIPDKRDKEREFYETIQPRIKFINVPSSAENLIEFIKHIRTKTKDAVIFVDYIQKTRSENAAGPANRFTELKFICEDLNETAIQTGLPIALAAQFNRDVWTPVELHPTKLAEASDVEKIASEVIGIWNCTKKFGRHVPEKELKAINEKYGVEFRDTGNGPEKLIVEVLKSRSLSTGHFVTLDFSGNTGRIYADWRQVKKELKPIFEKSESSKITKSVKNEEEEDPNSLWN